MGCGAGTWVCCDWLLGQQTMTSDPQDQASREVDSDEELRD